MTKPRRTTKPRARRARAPRLGIRALAYQLGELERRVDEIEWDAIDVADLGARLDVLAAAVLQLQLQRRRR